MPSLEYIAPVAVPNSNDAVRLAKADLLSLPPYLRCTQRYIFAQEGITDGRTKRIASVLLQYIHRAATVVRPTTTTGGWLLRIDLNRLAPQHRDYEPFRLAWEELRYDPTFNRLYTLDQLRKIDPALFPKRTITKTRPK